ncbi:MAG TPA: hypothetical protein VKB79_04590 [Bryobacteraceae bacterium]|nr:hypothetical protein [Bryobacteraceae bacterium]
MVFRQNWAIRKRGANPSNSGGGASMSLMSVGRANISRWRRLFFHNQLVYGQFADRQLVDSTIANRESSDCDRANRKRPNRSSARRESDQRKPRGRRRLLRKPSIRAILPTALCGIIKITNQQSHKNKFA